MTKITHITYISHIISMTKITHITYIPHTIKLILKVYKKLIKYLQFFFLYIKMTNNYYQKQKERLQKEALEKYQNLFEEKKDKRQKKTSKKYLN